MYHKMFAFLSSVVADGDLCSPFVCSTMLKEFIAFEWLWNQWTLHLHCFTLGVVSSRHFSLQLYYNCSPRNQIMQTRSVLLRAKVTSKCKISRALRDKQDHRKWEQREQCVLDMEMQAKICPYFIDHNDLTTLHSGISDSDSIREVRMWPGLTQQTSWVHWRIFFTVCASVYPASLTVLMSRGYN